MTKVLFNKLDVFGDQLSWRPVCGGQLTRIQLAAISCRVPMYRRVSNADDQKNFCVIILSQDSIFKGGGGL